MAMLDAGDGTYVDPFSGGSGEPKGSILRLALRASGTITKEPTDAVLEGAPPVCYSFWEEPGGEQIELLQADVF